MRVTVITGSPDGAPFRLRMQPLIESLQNCGAHAILRVRPRAGLPSAALRQIGCESDCVILHRRLLDPPEARELRRSARRIILDIDDAIMFDHEWRSPMSLWRRRRRFFATAASVDHVVAGNEYLADIFRRRGCRTSVLPTSVAPEHYRIKQHQPSREITLVWIGSHSTMKYLGQLLPAIELARRQMPGLRLLTICDRPLSWSPVPAEWSPWSVEGEAEALCRGDIGIAPLPDDRWTRGKCGFKIVQYMASGLPVIASPVGAQARMVRPGETGLLASSAQQWADAIARLGAQVELRTRLGGAGRALVESRYCVARVISAWKELLRATRPENTEGTENTENTEKKRGKEKTERH